MRVNLPKGFIVSPKKVHRKTGFETNTVTL
jgi:hypothetical protein